MNIVLIGSGRMASAVRRLAEVEHRVTGVFDSKNPLTPSSFSDGVLPDVAIDFSVPEAIPGNVATCCHLEIPLVVGTTGWQHERRNVEQIVREQNGSVLCATNFSVGMAIVRQMLRNALPLINRSDEFDVRIHETHHELKVDSPSGTALTLADLLLSGLDRKTTIRSTPTRSLSTTIAEPTGPTTTAEPAGPTTIADKDDPEAVAVPDAPATSGSGIAGNGRHGDGPDLSTAIQISSDRIGSVIGRHSIEFSGLFDSITLTHEAESRDGFAAGAILAAEWLIGRRGIYSFDDVFVSKPIQKRPKTRPSSTVSHMQAFGV